MESCRWLEWDHAVYLPSLKDYPPPDCLLLFYRQSANQTLEEGVLSDKPWFGILLLHKILNGSMVSMNNNFRINNILPTLITSKHYCQEFLLGSSIILLSTIKCFSGIVDDIRLLVNPLS